MGEISLSICIATFKRAEFIGETLEAIALQCPGNVEIVVLDGASPDNTQQIVAEYQKRFPCIRYFRQETNKGVDEDFCRAVALARGEYCWLMSDDDILRPDAVKKVLKEIQRDYSLIIVNADVRSADLSEVLEPKRLYFDKNRIYSQDKSEKLFIDTARYLSFIGCVVIKKTLWDSREKKKYYGTVFIHVGVIFQHPVPGETLVIAEPLISIRYGNAQWSARGFEIWMFKWPELIWSFPDLSDRAKQMVCHRYPWRRLLPLFNLRALGVFSFKEYEKLIKPHADNVLLRLAVYCICLIPEGLLNFAGILFYSLVREDCLTVLDLRKSRAYWGNIFG